MVTSRIRFTAAAEGRSLGALEGTVRVLRLSRGRWKGGTRPALSGSFYAWRDRAGAAPESWLGSTET